MLPKYQYLVARILRYFFPMCDVSLHRSLIVSLLIIRCSRADSRYFSLLVTTRYFVGRYSLLGIRYLNRYSGTQSAARQPSCCCRYTHSQLNQRRPSHLVAPHATAESGKYTRAHMDQKKLRNYKFQIQNPSFIAL